MPSNAYKSFKKNAEDVTKLLTLHETESGTKPGRRFGLEVLNKSAVVLITSFWEAYCEDIVSEGLACLVEKAPSASKLPTELKKLVAKELKADVHELRIWDVADGGWREVLRKRLTELQERRNRRLNTPKSENIINLFNEGLGITDITDAWKWNPTMTPAKAKAKLDKYVELRNQIAHRGAASASVKKQQVTEYFKFVKGIVSRTGGAVNHHVRQITGQPLFKNV